MKVLSVQQPHADLILFGNKWCENRSWRTNYRGEIFIHGSKVDSGAMKHYRECGVDPVEASPGKCRTSAIIGSVMLHSCVEVDFVNEAYFWIFNNHEKRPVPAYMKDLVKLLKQAKKDDWQHVGGPWCWIFTDPQPIEPITGVKGKLGLWNRSA